MTNLDFLKNMLIEAKENLHDDLELQKKYPESFGIKIMIMGWEHHIKELEKKIEEEHGSK